MKNPLCHFLVLLSVLGSATVFAAVPVRPNIIYIMSDDHAAHAISAYGSAVNQTPNLDRLAREGIRFDRCYAVNSICTPSRATILTGKYSHKNGVPVFNLFNGEQPHVARMLQAAGYQTAIIGKWHLGSDPTGFDHWEILPGQGRYEDPVLYDSDGARVYQGYVTDVITDLAIAWLLQRAPDKPFFLMLHHKAPHREWTPTEKHRRMFAQRQIPEAPTLYDDYATRTDALREQNQSVFKDLTRRDLKLVPPPDLKGKERQTWLQQKPTEVELTDANGQKRVLTGTELDRWKYQRYMQDYLACIQSVDDNVGRLLDWLDAYQLGDNTIVIYTSDQGFFLGDHGLYDKRFFYEESPRMPFLVRWPGVAKPGSTTDALAINADFAPTFLAAAGLEVPAEMQGMSLLPLLRGERPANWRRSFYYRYYHDPGHHNTRAHYAVRTETHKLIYYFKKDQWECFDLVNDPRELRNIYNEAAAQPVVAELKQELARLRQQLQDNDEFANELPKDGVDGPPKKWKPGYGPQ
jgi:arylsulfatase A-like enzyme